MNIALTLFSIALILAYGGWQLSLNAFIECMERTDPELWETFQDPNWQKYQEPKWNFIYHSKPKELLEYIWKREYLTLENRELIQKGNRARFFHAWCALSGTGVVICCIRLLLPI